MNFIGRRSTSRIACALLLCIMMFGASCGGDVPTQTPSADVSRGESRAPQRIISLSPNVTEILHGVGAFSRVVAVSDYCDYPPAVKDLPRIGGWQNTNLERLASFRPDLIIMAEAQAPFVKDKLDALGLRTLVVPSRTLADAFTSITEVGRATGNVAEAEKLLDETRAKIEEVRARAKDLPKRRVLCVVDRVPGTLRDLYTAADDSFFVELIEAAGGESIAPPGETVGWGKITKEAVVALDPEVIIDMVQGAPKGQLAEDPQAVWRELPRVRAVRDGRVHALRETSVLHPSQFVGDTARRFAEIIHPEVFKANEK